MLKLGAVVFCLSWGVSALTPVEAADNPSILLYRYVDSRGVTVMDTQGVPPEYVGKGYEVLNQRGRVIQVIPPAPSAEEVRQAQAAKVQADADAQLTHLYTSLADIDRARTRRLAELDALIAVAQGNVQGLVAQQASLQSQAADQERAGRQVPKTLIDQMDDLRDQQQNLKGDIQRYQTTRQQADAAYEVDRARLQKLLQP
ncbi:DUF4124 domain-containing protein [Pseudomonas huanghezhanensis]|uniref:DUF4124 domain-containing protein n=1 Tax=Pseudomonas huanghezhanensis TaxID=3002903 RepID=UPI002285953B|nr:DUF4124 domain-containing protein [Pseudomonas sp. BSw22131]